MDQPTLIVSSEDSPEVLRRVNDRLAEALPHTERCSSQEVTSSIPPTPPSWTSSAESSRRPEMSMIDHQPRRKSAAGTTGTGPWCVTAARPAR
jgi:hypothetical protein